MPLSEYIKYIIIAILISLSTLLIAQAEIPTTDFSQEIKWEKYTKSKGILIEYCFVENHPKRGYNSEFLILKITNLTNTNKIVSWDFSSVFENGKHLNSNTKNPELHFESEILKKSYLVGNINSYFRGPLVIFHCFKDEDYKGEGITKWKDFNLKNLIIK